MKVENRVALVAGTAPGIGLAVRRCFIGQPVGRTDDIAKAVCFLASDDITNINGCLVSVDGGLSLVNALGLMQA